MKKGLPIGIGIIIAAGIVVTLSLNNNNPDSAESMYEEPEWNRSGPFAINKEKYRVGDKVFISIQGLQPQDRGEVQFYTPGGIKAHFIKFDGSQKSGFNQYYEPDTSPYTKIYEPKQLIGNWTLKFTGTDYVPIKFEVIDEWVRGAEAEIKSIKRPNSTIGPSINGTN